MNFHTLSDGCPVLCSRISRLPVTVGQRIANYSVEFQREGSTTWELLVPPALANGSKPNFFFHEHVSHPTQALRTGLGDRPDGHDPRDQYVGHKRIDFPIVNTSEVKVASVRFNCIRPIEGADQVHIRSMALDKKTVPWE